jgi:hypothetical protein
MGTVDVAGTGRYLTVLYHGDMDPRFRMGYVRHRQEYEKPKGGMPADWFGRG